MRIWRQFRNVKDEMLNRTSLLKTGIKQLLRVRSNLIENGFGAEDIYRHMGLFFQTVSIHPDKKTFLSNENLIDSVSRYLRVTEGPQIDGLIFKGKSSPEFQERIINEWGSLPFAVKSELASEGFEFSAGGYGIELRPDYADKVMETSEDDNRSHINQISGIFFGEDFKAHVAEYYVTRRDDEASKAELSANSLISGDWAEDKRSGIVRHEVAHAFDRFFVKYTGIRASQTQEFVAAYEADLLALGGHENARAAGYSYFVRKDTGVGRSELFAEALAEVWGGSTTRARITNDWPNSSAHLKKFSQEFNASAELGSEAFIKFMGSAISCDVPQEKLAHKINYAWTERMRRAPDLTEEDISGWLRASEPDIALTSIAALTNREKQDRKPNDGKIITCALKHNIAAFHDQLEKDIRSELHPIKHELQTAKDWLAQTPHKVTEGTHELFGDFLKMRGMMSEIEHQMRVSKGINYWTKEPIELEKKDYDDLGSLCLKLSGRDGMNRDSFVESLRNRAHDSPEAQEALKAVAHEIRNLSHFVAGDSVRSIQRRAMMPTLYNHGHWTETCLNEVRIKDAIGCFYGHSLLPITDQIMMEGGLTYREATKHLGFIDTPGGNLGHDLYVNTLSVPLFEQMAKPIEEKLANLKDHQELADNYVRSLPEDIQKQVAESGEVYRAAKLFVAERYPDVSAPVRTHTKAAVRARRHYGALHPATTEKSPPQQAPFVRWRNKGHAIG